MTCANCQRLQAELAQLRATITQENPACINRMTIHAFREFGLLQEVNRQFFHPLGLALEVHVNDDLPCEIITSLWDYRDDPEGMIFGGELEPYREKAQRVADLAAEKRPAREAALGFWIQPLPEEAAE